VPALTGPIVIANKSASTNCSSCASNGAPQDLPGSALLNLLSDSIQDRS
jgi:hypothetical protein